jgi:hypothetical protein
MISLCASTFCVSSLLTASLTRQVTASSLLTLLTQQVIAALKSSLLTLLTQQVIAALKSSLLTLLTQQVIAPYGNVQFQHGTSSMRIYFDMSGHSGHFLHSSHLGHSCWGHSFSAFLAAISCIATASCSRASVSTCGIGFFIAAASSGVASRFASAGDTLIVATVGFSNFSDMLRPIMSPSAIRTISKSDISIDDMSST